MSIRIVFLLFFLSLVPTMAQAPKGHQYDEARVPKFELRDPLRLDSGETVKRSDQSWNERRTEILGSFEKNVYGVFPRTKVRSQAKLLSEKLVFDGRAKRYLIDLVLSHQGRELTLHLLLYRPVDKSTAPVLLGMNFYGNQSVVADPDIPLTDTWVGNNATLRIEGNRASEDSRGSRSERWPIEYIIDRGYGLCTLNYGDVDPDFDDNFQNGAHKLLGLKEDWGSVSAWAWGLSQVRSFLEHQTWVSKVGVFGHSRLGKTALWAGANDPGFGFVVSNNSGCGGAALSKRQFGERLKAINTRFPHWFAKSFHAFNEREAELPLDQHLLLASISPRALYVTSASEDLWADPKGEQLSVEFARPAFEELGGRTGYHMRPGRHNMLLFDWKRILDFADQNWD